MICPSSLGVSRWKIHTEVCNSSLQKNWHWLQRNIDMQSGRIQRVIGRWATGFHIADIEVLNARETGQGELLCGETSSKIAVVLHAPIRIAAPDLEVTTRSRRKSRIDGHCC